MAKLQFTSGSDFKAVSGAMPEGYAGANGNARTVAPAHRILPDGFARIHNGLAPIGG